MPTHTPTCHRLLPLLLFLAFALLCTRAVSGRSAASTPSSPPSSLPLVSSSSSSPASSQAISSLEVQQRLVDGELLYTILVDGQPWLYGSGVTFSADNHTYSTANRTLTLAQSTHTTGTDLLGFYNQTVYTWKGTSSSVRFVTAITVYPNFTATDGVPAGLVLFRMAWPDGAVGVGGGAIERLSSSFPSFDTSHHADVVEQGYYHFNSNWESTTEPHVWNSAAMPRPPALLSGEGMGPLMVFDKGNSSVRQVASMLSPLTSFMEASQVQGAHGELQLGLMDSYRTIPVGYSLEHVLYVEAGGVTRMVEHWAASHMYCMAEAHEAFFHSPFSFNIHLLCASCRRATCCCVCTASSARACTRRSRLATWGIRPTTAPSTTTTRCTTAATKTRS